MVCRKRIEQYILNALYHIIIYAYDMMMFTCKIHKKPLQ